MERKIAAVGDLLSDEWLEQSEFSRGHSTFPTPDGMGTLSAASLNFIFSK
ncbi:hypothetical protein ACDX66_04575 [Peribacillus frigoritolerans]